MNLFSHLTDPANWTGSDGLGQRIGQHLAYSGLSLLLAAVIAIAIGIAIGHTRRGNVLVAGISNATRAIPTLGLLVLVVVWLGTGLGPVVIALAVLAIPPILNATVAGFRTADPSAVFAAKAMGMTPWQVISKVELPLSLPLIVSGLRSASLQVIATATVAALAGSEGLGRLVVDGQRRGTGGYPEMFAGALLVALLAILVDVLLGTLAWALERRGRGTHSRLGDEVDSDEVADGTSASGDATGMIGASTTDRQ